jgi:CHAT domain-containing protein
MKTDNRALTAAALWGAGSIAKKTGALQEAIAFLKEASSILKDSGLHKDAIWTDYELGQSYLDAGDFQKAGVVFSDVIAVSEREKLTELTTGAHFELGRAFEGLSDFEKALVSYRSAIRQLRAGNWTNKMELEAETLLHMAKIHRWLSQYEETIESSRLAAIKYQGTGNAKGQADALAQLAEIFFWIAEPKISMDYYKQALDIYRVIGDLPKQIEVLAALGESSFLMDEASTYFEDGQQLVASLTGFDPYIRLKSAEKLTQEEIAKLFQEWREMLPTLNRESRMAAGTLYQKWGRMLLEGNNPRFAQLMLQSAFEYHSILPPLKAAQVDREMAIELAKDAYFLGEALRHTGPQATAVNYFRFVEQMATALRTPEIHFAYSGLARTYADLGDMDTALDYYKKGIAALESVQGQQGTEEIQIGVFAGALYAYAGLPRLLVEMYARTKEKHYFDQSFEYNERLKARVFVDMLERSQRFRTSDKTQREPTSEDEIRRQIVQIHHRLQTAKLQRPEQSQLLDQLEILRENWRRLQQETPLRDPIHSRALFMQPVTVATVQAVLDSDTALLEYATASEGSVLWVITKEQAGVYKIAGSELQVTLENYLKTVQQPLIGTDELSSHILLGEKLYRELLKPAEGLFLSKKHLIVVADGPLNYLPFETLIVPKAQDPSAHTTRISQVDYLIKRYSLSYVASASVLVAQRHSPKSDHKRARLPIIAFGDPIYREIHVDQTSVESTGKISNLALRGQDFKRLAFSGDEVRRVVQAWGISQNSENIYIRDRATVDRVRNLDLSQYRILHFAAHAVLGDQLNMFSQPAIVLSQSKTNDVDDGLLQFSDVLNLKLDADLVVLSACETGLGRLRDGEGIIGLTRAFLYAGASSAAVSLWKVEDQSTSLLMQGFHQNLKRGLSKTEALRQAKLAIMHSTVKLKVIDSRQDLAAPFYWAPFILIGDSGPIQAN